MMALESDDADREYCRDNGIHYCEPGNPYQGKGRCMHTQAVEVDDSQESGWPSGDTVIMRCPVCNTSWTMELPQ